MKILHIKVSEQLHAHLVHLSNTQQIAMSALVRQTLAKHTNFVAKKPPIRIEDIDFDE